MNSMKVSDYIHQYVPYNLRPLFWSELKKWDNSVTGGTFYDLDVLNTMLKYAEQRGG